MKNHVLKKLPVFALAAVMTIGGPSLSAFAEAESTEPEESVSAEDDTAKAIELLEEIKGTYEPLFPIITDSQYDQLWLDPCIAVVGEEAAPEVAEMLKAACNGTIYGQEAIDAFGDGSEGAQFDCLFINGPSAITFDGNIISGTDENGDQLFSHEYRFIDGLSLAGLMEGFLYETEDEDAGEFKYFYMMPDTPATTYHLEFRYGSDATALAQYNEGPYAYWLAAGFPVDADEEMVNNVITLFCEENLAEMAEEEAGDTAASAIPESDGEEVIEIATAEELAEINENLSGHYVLTADIDLGGEEWTPIGTYAPSGESPEEQEIPSDEYAFTGSFDGQGHTISNLSVHQPEGWAIGLFGCIANTQIGNFTLENAQVEGTVMVSCVVGYAYNSEVKDVQLASGKVDVNFTEMSSEGMYGGIVGAGMGSRITDCEAQTEINLPDGAANAGIIGGGLEMTSVVNCTSTGSITAGDNCYGLGAISGCGFGSEEFTNCYAQDVVIKAGEGSTWIGKITGYAGGFEDESAGIPVTIFTNCTSDNVTIDVPEGTEGVGDIVGAGFYSEEAAEAYGAPYDQPTVFVIAEKEQENAA